MPDHHAGQHVQRREQGGGAVALVVVSHRLPAALRHRQRRLRAVKRLHRGLLVGAQHDRVLRRVQIQTHDIDEFLLELRVVGHLERVDLVRFEAQLLPYPMHGALRDPGNPGHRPCAPMRLALRPVFLGERHDPLQRGVWDRGLAASPLTDLPELDQTVLGEPSAPVRHGGRRHRHRGSDRRVRRAVGGHQQSLGPHAGSEISVKVFYSIGGGFILAEGEKPNEKSGVAPMPYPFTSAAELLELGQEKGKAIWEMVLENEKTLRSETEITLGVFRIWQAMEECTQRGFLTEGILPGGLNVWRRAPKMYRGLIKRKATDPLNVVDWINVFAMAVNEENAAGGRVVTAPTNGAAGIIPAVGHYYQKFIEEANDDGIFRYLLTAGAIGIIYKENASISGAEVGCQGEVGVACSMARPGGLVAALGGTNEQIEHAAEIGMEHNLGMTCDPIAGLVQIPCIERNAFGAAKAVNAARMAMNETEGHKVSLDQVIRTMFETGRDMQARYKETSLAGLAVNVVEC